MKKIFKILLYILIIIAFLGIIFFAIDSVRIYDEKEPIFIIEHKILDGIDWSAKVDIGLGYKIIRYELPNKPEIVKAGTIFMEENLPEEYYLKDEDNVEENTEIIEDSGEISEDVAVEESGEEIKLTTFGEKSEDIIYIEGEEMSVLAEDINSKLGYTMKYYYELFEYAGFDSHDTYTWKLTSGDSKAFMTIYDMSDDTKYEESLNKIEKDKNFEELSGDSRFEKFFSKNYKENDIDKKNHTYYMQADNIRLMIESIYPLEAEEGIGRYIDKMITTIK